MLLAGLLKAPPASDRPRARHQHTTGHGFERPNVEAHRRAAAMEATGAVCPARPSGAHCSASLYVSSASDLYEYVHEPLRPNVGHRDAVDLRDSLPYLGARVINLLSLVIFVILVVS